MKQAFALLVAGHISLLPACDSGTGCCTAGPDASSVDAGADGGTDASHLLDAGMPDGSARDAGGSDASVDGGLAGCIAIGDSFTVCCDSDAGTCPDVDLRDFLPAVWGAEDTAEVADAQLTTAMFNGFTAGHTCLNDCGAEEVESRILAGNFGNKIVRTVRMDLDALPDELLSVTLYSPGDSVGTTLGGGEGLFLLTRFRACGGAEVCALLFDTTQGDGEFSVVHIDVEAESFTKVSLPIPFDQGSSVAELFPDSLSDQVLPDLLFHLENGTVIASYDAETYWLCEENVDVCQGAKSLPEQNVVGPFKSGFDDYVLFPSAANNELNVVFTDSGMRHALTVQRSDPVELDVVPGGLVAANSASVDFFESPFSLPSASYDPGTLGCNLTALSRSSAVPVCVDTSEGVFLTLPRVAGAAEPLFFSQLGALQGSPVDVLSGAVILLTVVNTDIVLNERTLHSSVSEAQNAADNVIATLTREAGYSLAAPLPRLSVHGAEILLDYAGHTSVFFVGARSVPLYNANPEQKLARKAVFW